MIAQNQFEKILKYIKDYKTKNEGNEAKNIDDFCDRLSDFVNDNSNDFNDLEYVFSADYDFRVDRKDDLMDYFNQQVLPIDYSDYEDIDNFMENIKTCDEWCYVDLVNNKVEKWEDVASTFIESAEETIKDIYSKNFERAKDYE